MNAPQKLERTCPQCGYQMGFSGNGRSLICDRCHHTQEIQTNTKQRSLRDFMLLRSLHGRRPAGDSRTDLRYAIAAAKDGDANNAINYLEDILSTTAPDEITQEAWFQLSQLYHSPADQRACLEECLAINPAHGEARRELAIIDGRLSPDDLIDANTFQQTTTAQPRAIIAQKMQCSQCASPMRYEAEQNSFLCDHCGHIEELDIDEDSLEAESQFGEGAFEQDFTAALHKAAGHSQPQATRTMQCKSCGIQFVLAPQTLSLTCPYCTAVYVTETAETRQLLPPQALIPFDVTAEAAKNALKAWLHQHNIHKKRGLRFSNMVGLYIPVWTFDIGGDIRWTGYIEKRNQNHGRTEQIPINGNKFMYFDDVATPATARRGKIITQAVNAFDFTQLIPYDPRYLADWPAERYKIKLSDAAVQARKTIVKQLLRHPQDLVSGHSSRVKEIRISTQNIIIESYKLILLPLWMLHYTHDDQTYDVIINGQNAEVYGQRNQNPLGQLWSWLKNS